MSQIKSEKAECLLNAAKQSNVNGCPVSLGVATKAVIIAETEAEERHAKELQGFKNYIESILDVIDNADHLCEVKRFVELNADFTQKLNEK